MSSVAATAFDATKYRTAWLRFCAGFVDGVIFLPIILLLSWVGAHVSTAVLVPLYLFANAMGFAYSVLLHGLFGQTLGKKALHVKVLDVNEGPLSMRQAILRDSPWIVVSCIQMFWGVRYLLSGGNPLAWDAQVPMPAFLQFFPLLWFMAEVLTMLTNAKRRALHDWIAGSVVVRV